MHDTIHICKEALATNNIDDAAKAIARIREIRRMYPDIYKVCDNASLKEAKRLEDEMAMNPSQYPMSMDLNNNKMMMMMMMMMTMMMMM
ncbi:hypothetical protein Pmar_PMAR021460, partial [Perkinsus marinus ATCC 50983]